MLTQNVYSVGTATSTVVAPTVDSGRYVLKNLEPANEVGELSRQGYIYAVSRYQTIANGGTAIFSFTTGDTGAQFEFWTFTAENSSILASLIEGATITSTGTAIPAYNLDRNSPDTYDAVLEGATALTGGTTILSEYVPASNQAGGGMGSNKIITLEPNTEYGFKFVDVGGNGTPVLDVGGNGTPVHIQIGWAEKYNGYNDVWLGTADESFVLGGGEQISMYLRPYETINATALRDGCQLAVMRQD